MGEAVSKQEAFYRKKLNLVLLAAICTFMWGTALALVKMGYTAFAIDASSVFVQIFFAGVRFFAAGVVILIFDTVRRRKVPILPAKEMGSTVVLGLLQTGVQYSLLYVGLAHTTGTNGAICNATSVFMTILVAPLFFRKKDPVTARKLIGCLIGLSGIVLVNIGGASAGFSFMGEGLVLLSSVCLAFAANLTKVFAKNIDPMTLMGWQFFFGGGAMLIVGLLAGERFAQVTAYGVTILVLLILIAAVAFTIWTNLLKYNPVTEVSTYNFLTPTFGVIMSSILLDEGFPGITAVIALLLVCAGIIIANRT